MKQNFIYALLGAIALSGAASLTACSSSDEIVDNPNYNPETNTVKTQFTISFPENVAKTRQSAAAVQDAGTIESFRGMDNIVLYPFAATGDAGKDPINSASTKLGGAIALTSMIKPNTTATINNSIPAKTLTAASNSVLYNDVAIPVGTGSFLFYGKAIDSGTDKFSNGSLALAGNQPSDIKFTLEQIYSAGTTASNVGAKLAEYLSSIAQAEHWAECTVSTNSSETWYNQSLGDLYTKFTHLKAGSSKTAQAAVQDLYETIKNNTDAVSIAIKTAITNETYATVNATTGELEFKVIIGNSTDTYFPRDVNLPDGAAFLSYASDTKTFTQKVDGDGNTGSIKAKYADYVYPSSLYYYCNSGIKTSNSSKVEEYNGTQNWSTITGKYTDGTSVSVGSRSVAILDPIQYGVGRLDATVKTEAMTLYDKKGDAYTVDATKGFTVTGILIGGQQEVKFDFTPNTNATRYTIFDNIEKSQTGTTLTATTTASATNYTLALETEKDKSVYVAIELVNNGKDFEGADGVVPSGCRFYLVAELTPSSGTGYNATTLNQVFKQDYKTIVTFTIKAGTAGQENNDGLAKAYNTIPDLRSPELELGLSVDLTWQSGLQFDINL